MKDIKKFEVDLMENPKCKILAEANLERAILADIQEIESFAMVEHKTPPKGYPKDKSEYADPSRYKYPINSKSRVLSAWRYINQKKNQKGYSAEEISQIKSRIKKAGKKYGLDLKEGE